MPTPFLLQFRLDDSDATEALARRLAPLLGSGDTLTLTGPIGAGKSLFARALIQTRLAEKGLVEDIPSPTFTLVQCYEAGELEIWHCDLYRLTHADEVLELGLDAAFEHALCIVEWPEKLGPDLPDTALALELRPDPTGDGRDALLSWRAESWTERLRYLTETADAN